MADIHAQIEAERKAALPEAAKVQDFREYARGRQLTTLTTGQVRVLTGLLGNLFCDNVCKHILQEMRNRLKLVRFDVSGQGPAADAVNEYLRTWWTLNGLAALAGAVHWATLRDGNHAVSLAWSPAQSRVIVARERWWNGRYGMFVGYDDYDQPAYAVRDWRSAEGERRTIWFKDRIERYLRDGEGWKPFRLAADGEQWPTPWVTATGEPIGLPVVHFGNGQMPNDGRGDYGATEPSPLYGMSELDGGLLGLQDEINDIQRDITASARFAGFQMLYGVGVQNQYDETGAAISFTVEPGAFYTDPNADAKFGALPPGDLTQLEKALSIKLQAVSRQSSIPLYTITGDWPSGEALLRAEQPAVDKAEAQAAGIGPAWASVAHKATRLCNIFGGTLLDENLMISAVFAPVARRDPLTRAAIVAQLGPHLSKQEILRQLGYSAADVAGIMSEIEAEAIASARQRAETAKLFRDAGAPARWAFRQVGISETELARLDADAQAEQEAQQVSLASALLQAQRNADQGQNGELVQP